MLYNPFVFNYQTENMTFRKGQPPPPNAGRPKGSVNKRNLDTQATFERIVAKHGDPLEALAEMAFDPTIDIAIRNGSLKEVVKYGYAQRKAVEISGPDGDPVKVDVGIFDDALDLLKTAARNKPSET